MKKLTAVEMVEACARRQLDVFYCVGGNFLRTLPEPDYVAEAMSRERKANQTVIWTNQYGKARVFGTTIGHYDKTMADPEFLQFASKMRLDLNPVTGATMEKLLADIYRTPAGAVERARAVIK
jgi:hypothetical protein